MHKSDARNDVHRSQVHRSDCNAYMATNMYGSAAFAHDELLVDVEELGMLTLLSKPMHKLRMLQKRSSQKRHHRNDVHRNDFHRSN